MLNSQLMPPYSILWLFPPFLILCYLHSHTSFLAFLFAQWFFLCLLALCQLYLSNLLALFLLVDCWQLSILPEGSVVSDKSSCASLLQSSFLSCASLVHPPQYLEWLLVYSVAHSSPTHLQHEDVLLAACLYIWCCAKVTMVHIPWNICWSRC